MTKEQMIEAFKRLKELGAKRFGIHSFLASNTVTNEYYPTLAGILFELAVELKERDRCGYRIYQSFRRSWHSLYVRIRSQMISLVIGEGVRQKV